MKNFYSQLSCAISKIVAMFVIIFVSATLTSCSDDVDYTFYTTIAGSVLDANTGEPISNVSITLTPSNKSVTSDNAGSFEFQNLDVQQYTIIFQKAGYQTNRKNVTPTVGEITRIDVTLSKIPN